MCLYLLFGLRTALLDDSVRDAVGLGINTLKIIIIRLIYTASFSSCLATWIIENTSVLSSTISLDPNVSRRRSVVLSLQHTLYWFSKSYSAAIRSKSLELCVLVSVIFVGFCELP